MIRTSCKQALRQHGHLKSRFPTLAETRQILYTRRPNARTLHTVTHHPKFLKVPRPPVPGKAFEEETLPGYQPEQFYPVHIGECLGGRYLVVGKLGYGAYSTVWLCRNTKTTKVVAVKVYIGCSPCTINRELVASEHLAKIQSSRPGQALVRQPLDTFYIQQRHGDQHLCLVYEALQASIRDLQRLGGRPRSFPEDLARTLLHQLLVALDFMHTEANMVHCDIKLSNIMFQIEDSSVLSAFEEDETANPTPRKVIDADRTIYATRKLRHPEGHAFGPPVLCDLGEARIGSSFLFIHIQPEVYQAPEVLLQIDWDQWVDIWNVACVAWDMVTGGHQLFDGYEEGHHNNRVHIGEIVGLIGHPPLDFQHRSGNSWRVFDSEGKWKGNPPLSPDTLESKLEDFPAESKDRFLTFLRSMLRWRPEDRATARELLADPWLNENDEL